MQVAIQFIHVTENRIVDAGPFDFAQVTYNTLRVSNKEAEDQELAYYESGYWRYKDKAYTDFLITTAVDKGEQP